MFFLVVSTVRRFVFGCISHSTLEVEIHILTKLCALFLSISHTVGAQVQRVSSIMRPVLTFLPLAVAK